MPFYDKMSHIFSCNYSKKSINQVIDDDSSLDGENPR